MSNVSIVTGGCGFIGSHVVDRLMAKGHEVIVIDDKSAESNDKFFENPKIYESGFKASYFDCSITDYEKIAPLFIGVDYVFHLGAESRIQPTLERPQDACMTNFVGTCNVLQAARANGVKRVMYSSTSSGYGLKNEPPLREDMERDCLNPYAVTKVAAEDLARMYYTLWGLETVIFRYFNIYGDREPTKGQYAPVVGLFLKQFRDNEVLSIVGDGTQRRDFTHVDDVVQANMLAMESDNPGILGEIFNVGTGKNCSVLELAQMISDNYTFIPSRPGEAKNTLADISKARTLLNYSPTITIEEWIKQRIT
jgi:UDP-glucose 4-epimerase